MRSSNPMVFQTVAGMPRTPVPPDRDLGAPPRRHRPAPPGVARADGRPGPTPGYQFRTRRTPRTGGSRLAAQRSTLSAGPLRRLTRDHNYAATDQPVGCKGSSSTQVLKPSQGASQTHPLPSDREARQPQTIPHPRLPETWVDGREPGISKRLFDYAPDRAPPPWGCSGSSPMAARHRPRTPIVCYRE
jgi:hypothetical protein